MREGEASPTAQRVAAYRLGFDRLPAPFGDPGADDRLAGDVAGSITFEQREDLGRYLRWRTAFFDRIVLRALERDVLQVATIAAGYDGRSLRYAKPGVRWFEVDHPDTQANKQLRLDRLAIDASQITFIGIDLADEAVSAGLIAGGWDPDAPSVMLCEGLSVYLEAEVFQALLGDLRAVATVGTRLAMSLSIQVHGPEELARRARLEEVVAALGEPVRNRLDHDGAAEMLASTRWRLVDVSENAERAGFVVAAPLWEPAASGAKPTAGRIGRFMERTYYRHGMAGLPAHLEAAYRISVKGVRELDVGVVRVERRDGPDWVARVFARERPRAAADGDAEILRFLKDAEFPAERCAHSEAVTTYEGQAVLVTEYVAGRKAGGSEASFRVLGVLLGRLHTVARVSGAGERPGGGWHHLALDGSPRDEVAAARALLDEARARVPEAQRTLYATLRDELDRADDCEGLPECLIHPDFVPANAIASRGGGAVLVDWTAAGRGPRLWPLAFLLWAAGSPRSVQAVVAGYRRHAELEPAELDRLAGAVATRPVIFESWAFWTGRKRLPEVIEGVSKIRSRAERIGALVAELTGR